MAITSAKIQVEPAQLRSELERIRREAAELDVKREELFSDDVKPRVRTTLANVVLFMGLNPGLKDEDFEELITGLCVSYPSRFFVVRCVDGDSYSSDTLQTAVSSRCVFAKSGMHVCSEEVYLFVRSEEEARIVPNVLLSLMEPDIESVLVLLCNPSAQPAHFEELLERLSSVSDILVVDSSLYSPFKDGNLIAARAAEIPPAAGFNDTVLRDIHWIRQVQWRQLIAEHFETFITDNASICLSRLTLHGQNTSPTPGADMLLLMAWIISRLDLRIEKAVENVVQGRSKLEMKCRDFRNRLTLINCQTELTSKQDMRGSLRSVELLVDCSGPDSGKATMQLHLSRKFGTDCIEVSNIVCVGESTKQNESASENALRRVPCSSQPLETLLVNSMSAHAVNKEYLSVCNKLSEIFDKLQTS